MFGCFVNNICIFRFLRLCYVTCFFQKRELDTLEIQPDEITTLEIVAPAPTLPVDVGVITKNELDKRIIIPDWRTTPSVQSNELLKQYSKLSKIRLTCEFITRGN